VGTPAGEPIKRLGRYALYQELAAGGMATVHYGRQLGSAGFARTIAIKRLHPQFAKDPEFVSMFLDEARLAARIRHPHVVPTLDVVATDGELFLVMEYVQGQSLARLVSALRTTGELIDLRMVTSILAGALHGLHAAHEAKDERGAPLGIVHRDVSPQNIIVGADGVARVLDFGVAKAAGRLQTTREGHVKGKLAYMAPEQLEGEVTRRTDIYAAGIVLWEVLAGERLFTGDNEGAVLRKVLGAIAPPPSEKRAERGALVEGAPREVLLALDAIVLRALERDPDKRFVSARDMAIALEGCVAAAPASEVGAWVERIAAEPLETRARIIAEIEGSCADATVAPASPDSAESGTANPPVSQGGGVDAVSQLSSVTVSRATESLRLPLRRRSRLGVVVATVSVGALTAVWLLVAREHAAQTAYAARPPLDEPHAASPPAPSAGPVVSTAPVISSAPVVSGSPPIADLPAPPLRASAVPVPRTTLPARARPRPSAPASSCSPPYTIDSAGRRHYRPECL
jgi:eukaryotic-like serine/threonine-protein kinase